MMVEVAYAKPDEQVILSVEGEEGMTVQEAIDASGILKKYPEIDLKTNKVGIFGKLTKMDAKMLEGDRVEIYRHLIADPKETRKRRAAEGKVMKKGAAAKNAAAAAKAN